MSTLPPGPSGLPVAGSTLSFVRDPFSTYERWAAEYGDMVAADIAGRTFVMVAHPEHIERILVTDQHHYGKGSFQRDQLGDIVGDGLLLSQGDFWREQRNRLQPQFFRERLHQYATTMVAETSTRAAKWSSGDTITLNSELQHLTLAIMARTLFRFDIEDAEGQFADTARTISERFNLSHVSTYLPAWIPTPRNRRYRRAMENLDTVIYDVIETRRAEDDSFDDLHSTLLEGVDDPETDLTDETLRDEIATVILGGHDTAALAMTYTLTALARHPEAEARVRAELDAVLGDDDPTVTDLPTLSRLDAAVKEAMRLYPPAYTLFREANRTTKIGVRGSRGRDVDDSVVGRPSRRPVVRIAGGVPPRPLDRRVRGVTAGVRVLPVRRRQAPLYRDALRVDGDETRGRNAPPAVPVRPATPGPILRRSTDASTGRPSLRHYNKSLSQIMRCLSCDAPFPALSHVRSSIRPDAGRESRSVRFENRDLSTTPLSCG